MTTPIDPLAGVGLPYTISLYAATPYWWYIETSHRNGSSYLHAMPRGEYQIVFTYSGEARCRMTVRQGGRSHQYDMVSTGPSGTTRSGSAVISITEEEGALEFGASGTIPLSERESLHPAVVTVFPFQSYTA